MEEQKYYTIILRHDTSTQWEVNNPVLKLGEYGVEDDTHRVKRGDGITAWSDLLYEEFGLKYLVTFENLKGDITDNSALTIALNERIPINIFSDNNYNILSSLSLTSNSEGILNISEVSKNIQNASSSYQNISITSKDSTIQSFTDIDETGKLNIDLKASGTISDFTSYYRYNYKQMCMYKNKLYRTNKELVSEETFNEENWDLLFSKDAVDITYDPKKTNLSATNIQNAIDELTQFSQGKLNLSNEANKLYGTDETGLTKMYDIKSLVPVKTVNNIEPDNELNITLNSGNIKYNDAETTTIKEKLDVLNSSKLNKNLGAQNKNKYLYIDNDGNIALSADAIVHSVTSDNGLVDNTDQLNPKVLRDNTKLDKDISNSLLTNFSIEQNVEDNAIDIQVNKVTVNNKTKTQSFLHLQTQGSISYNLEGDRLILSANELDTKINDLTTTKLNKDFLGENKLVEKVEFSNAEGGDGFKITTTNISPKDLSQAIDITNIISDNNSISIKFNLTKDESKKINITTDSNIIPYDNTESELQSTTIKQALDEIVNLVKAQQISAYEKNTAYTKDKIVYVKNENNITLLGMVVENYTSDNTQDDVLKSFELDITNNKISRIGIPNEVA